MKLAMFHNPNSDKPYVGDELTEKYCHEMVRTTEWVDVDFPALSDESRRVQLERIKKARAETKRLYETAISRIDQQAAALS